MFETTLQLLVWNTAVAAVLAFVVMALCWTPFIERRPALRHLLWLLVLVKLVTPPLIPLPVLGGSDPPSTVAEHRDLQIEASLADTRSFQPQTDKLRGLATPIPFESLSAAPNHDVDVNRVDATPARGIFRLTLTQLAIVSIAGAWFAVAVFLLGRSWFRVRQLSRLIRRASEGESRIKRITRDAAKRMNVHHVDVRAVDGHAPPMIWLARSGPIILFPKKLVEQLSDDQVTSIACHELAHYVRGDQWFNTFALFVTAVCWWHPVAWIAWREMGKAQELCCDEQVLDCCKVSRRSYLETLLQAFDFVQEEPLASAAPVSGFFDSRSIKSRFKALSSGKQIARNTWRTNAAILTLFAFLSCLPVSARTDEVVDEPDAADRITPAANVDDQGSDKKTSDATALFLHWYKPGYGDHEPPQPILTMKVTPSKDFDVFLSDRKAAGRQSSLEGRLNVKDGKYWAKIDARWKSAERFEGGFELEEPVKATVFTWSRGCAPTCIVLSRHPSSDSFIEEATKDFEKRLARVNKPGYLTDSSDNTLETAGIRLSTCAPEFGFHGGASLGNAIHSNTNSIYDSPVSDEVAGRNFALCREAIEAMFADAKLQAKWSLNIDAAKDEFINLKQSEQLRFVLDLGGGRKWNETTEVKLFLKGPPRKSNLDYRSTFPPAKSFLWFEFSVSKLKFPIRGCAMVRSAVYRHPGSTTMSRLPQHYFDLQSASNLPNKSPTGLSDNTGRTDDEE